MKPIALMKMIEVKLVGISLDFAMLTGGGSTKSPLGKGRRMKTVYVGSDSICDQSINQSVNQSLCTADGLAINGTRRRLYVQLTVAGN